ncbi:MAG: T9SS type A sorting domain-containing protein [Flavobacteriales bacterium]|nr:T9SS type A sorting domain-containing protein [Flavobacteriales bacterium]
MRKTLTLLIVILLNAPLLLAQDDTIRVQTLTYDSITTRRGWWVFPDESHTFRKVLMHHTLKCDPQTTQDGFPCGEWDYLTHSEVYEHTGVLDSTALQHPYFLVGTQAPDSVDQIPSLGHDQYQQWQQTPTLLSGSTETLATIGDGVIADDAIFHATLGVTRSQSIYPVNKLELAGLSAGQPIHQLRLPLTDASGRFRIKVRMKNNGTAGLTDTFVDTAFTTVYEANTELVNDLRLTLHSPFVWDGVQDILVDMIVEQLDEGSYAAISSTWEEETTKQLQHWGKDGYVELKNDHLAMDPAPMAQLGDAITITFKAFGAPELPMNTTMLEALDATGTRILNIHLPWSDGHMYWDAGNDGSGTDRIEKLAPAANIGGQWNTWAFVKNAATGSMKIYLNGQLWHTGTGKTKPLTGITQVRIGAGVNGDYPYTGALDDLNIFKTEVSAATIATWHDSMMSFSHPNYADLVYSYNFSEVPSATTALGIPGLPDAQLMGTVRRNRRMIDEMVFSAQTTSIRPNITFVQGDQTVVQDSTLASIPRPGSLLSIVEHAVQGNAVVPTDTIYGFLGEWNYTYAPDHSIVDSVYTTGAIHYNDTLNYFGEPFEVLNRFEIGRFITPYGINLSLGPQGFRWTYDVTDYQWLLHDSVELSAGNQQELIDLEFEMIEGTPPRSVVNHQRPWGQMGSYTYADLDNDVKLPPVTVQLDPAASQWSLRTRLTGHGHNSNTGDYPHCCEWKDNTHYVKVNGAQVDQWHIWQTNDCALNPVYPQGGTWLGSREGWCPGDVVKDHTVELTSVLSGGSVDLDYDITPVPGSNVGMGGGNYVINMDLLEFSAPSFALDAEILDVQRPSDADYRRRDNPICYDPLVELRNAGGTDLTEVTFTYSVSGGTPLTYTWNGNLKHMQTALVSLPVVNASFWNGDNEHVFTATVSTPNGGSDMYSANDSYNTTFALPSVYTTDVLLHYKTNNRPSENTVTVRDITGTVVFNRSAHVANTVYIDTLNLADGCYTVEVLDTGNDGLSYWADTDAGTGYFRLKKPNGATLQTFQSEFGRKLHWPFTVATGVGIDEDTKAIQLSAFPNPSHGHFSIDLGDEQGSAQYVVLNALGKEVENGSLTLNGNGLHDIDLSHLADGIYQFRVSTESGTGTLRLMKQ